MKRIAFVCAALMLACGVAVAKDAKRPAAMNDAEMDSVTAGDIHFLLLANQVAYIPTPGLNKLLAGYNPKVGATVGPSDGLTGVIFDAKHVEGGKNLGSLPPLPLPILPKP